MLLAVEVKRDDGAGRLGASCHGPECSLDRKQSQGGGFADKSAELVHPANGPTSLLLTKEIGRLFAPPYVPRRRATLPIFSSSVTMLSRLRLTDMSVALKSASPCLRE